jgi:hypothetical protein
MTTDVTVPAMAAAASAMVVHELSGCDDEAGAAKVRIRPPEGV